MLSVDRGKPDHRPVLFLHEKRRGLLVVPLPDGRRCQVEIAPRHSWLFVLPARAWCEDEAWPRELRGFRSAEWIGKELHRLTGYGPKPETVRSEVHRVTRSIREALDRYGVSREEFQRHFDVFERRSRLGYRIAQCGLTVVEVGESAEASE